MTDIISTLLLAGVAAYVLGSLFLLLFPGLLHRRKTLQAAPTLHSSHRGGSAESTENTLPAFRHAVRHGSELLELDVHLTRDRQVVVNHDADLSRQCGVKAQVSSYAYSELPRYLLPHKLPMPPQYYPANAVLGTQNGYIGPNGPFKSPKADVGRMPLLDEVFAEFVRRSSSAPARSSCRPAFPRAHASCLRTRGTRSRASQGWSHTSHPTALPESRTRMVSSPRRWQPDVWINIDIKALPDAGAAELTRLTHALIVKHGRQARTVWGSGKEANADGCYALDPSIPLLFTTRRVLLLLVLF